MGFFSLKKKKKKKKLELESWICFLVKYRKGVNMLVPILLHLQPTMSREITKFKLIHFQDFSQTLIEDVQLLLFMYCM